MAFPRLHGVGVFLGTSMRVQLHDPLAIATSAIVEAILLIFVWILAPALLPFALIGALVYSAFLIGQHVLNEAAYIRIDHKINELYLASPLSPEAYFVGLAGGILTAYLPTIVALLVLVEIVAPLSLAAWGALVLVLLATWAFSASLAYVISTLFKDMKAIWPYASILTNVLGVVPPVFYPLSLWPPEWQAVALVLPTSSAAALVEAAAGLQSLDPGAFLLAAGSLGVEAAAAFLFGIWWAHRSAREV